MYIWERVNPIQSSARSKNHSVNFILKIFEKKIEKSKLNLDFQNLIFNFFFFEKCKIQFLKVNFEILKINILIFFKQELGFGGVIINLVAQAKSLRSVCGGFVCSLELPFSRTPLPSDPLLRGNPTAGPYTSAADPPFSLFLSLGVFSTVKCARLGSRAVV